VAVSGLDGARVTARGLWVHESAPDRLPAADVVVVLVHGAMDRSGGMLRVRRALVAARPDLRVIRYDRRGYGRSRAAEPDGELAAQVDDLAEVVGDRPAVLAAHSFGGVVALALAERRPELIRAVMAYEPPMMWQPWWPHATSRTGDERPEDAAEWFLRRMIGDETWERLPSFMRADRRAEGRALVADLRSVRPPAPPPYAPERVTPPVVVGRGEHARPHHLRGVGELVARLPDATVQVVAGGHHGLHLTDPGAFAELVIRAVERAERP
jgi:pimeloyl-ACP methyl ester carboxylesterase